jgi:hypothetical protein
MASLREWCENNAPSHTRPFHPEGWPFFLKASFCGQKAGFKGQNKAIFYGYVNHIKKLLRSDPTSRPSIFPLAKIGVSFWKISFFGV